LGATERAAAAFYAQAQEKNMSANDHFTVSIGSLNNGLNDDRQSLSGHTLTVTPDGRLSIDSEKGQKTLAPGDWDDPELKMLPVLDKSSLADIG
jgi:hypothetical protein